MEMLVKLAEVLVKIAVMMMAPGSAPAPPEARGREPPFFFFFFFFLDLLPRWEKGFPSGPWLPSSSSSSLTFSLDGRRVSPLVLGSHGVGGARAPSGLDLSLCFCVLRFYPFTVSLISGDP